MAALGNLDHAREAIVNLGTTYGPISSACDHRCCVAVSLETGLLVRNWNPVAVSPFFLALVTD